MNNPLLSVILTFCCLSAAATSFAQGQAAVSADSAYHPVHHGAPVAAAVVLLEVCAAGYSAYAADKADYGDKVMGGAYSLCSAGMIAVGISEWINNKDEPAYSRIGDAVLYAGLSYGFARMAAYNLTCPAGDSRYKRFNRNFVEFHTTYIVPFGLELLTEAIIKKRVGSRPRVSIGVGIDRANLNIRL
jgi:hypothetical protein